MTSTSASFRYHLLAILTVAVWGTTFISTKVLLNEGLTPSFIMLVRFVIAYVCILPFTWRKRFAHSLADEFRFLLIGMFGGSLYFLSENTALRLSLVSNVSLIVCTAPILTALLFRLFHKGEVLRKGLVYGSVVAFTGVAVVIYSGDVFLGIHPAGDLLALCAALMWAIYSLLIKGLNSRYSSLFVIRKVFFYGIVTILPFVLNSVLLPEADSLQQPKIWLNLLFLGVVASMLCFHAWNLATKKLGVVRTTNYIYFTPLVTLLSANLLLGEVLPGPAWVGAGLIVAGVYLADK